MPSAYDSPGGNRWEGSPHDNLVARAVFLWRGRSKIQPEAKSRSTYQQTTKVYIKIIPKINDMPHRVRARGVLGCVTVENDVRSYQCGNK